MTFQNIKDIQDLIFKMVASKIDAGQVVNMHWATTEIMNNYSDISGADCDFYRIAAKHYISDQVKKSIQKFEPKSDGNNEQLVLDGFEHLQKAYPVKRGDDRELVPVDQIDDAELLERADEYERMAKGCMDHAAEIRIYVESRGKRNLA